MGESRPARLPLQIGVQALYSLAFASATLMPAAIALLATLFILIVKGGLIVFLLFSQGWVVAAGIVLLEIVLFVRGINHLRLAIRTRPADVVFDDKGFHIDGGRLHGRSIRWDDCKSVRQEERNADEWEVTLSRAVVELRDGTDVVVAEAADESELESLRALCDSVQAHLHPGDVAPLPPEEHPDLLRCPACAAPAAPIDAEHTTCSFCAATVPIPRALRDRLRATDEVLASSKVSAPLLAKLLAQPSARFATLLSGLAGIPIALMWMLAVFFGFVLYRHHGLRFMNVVLLSGSAIVTIVGCYYLVRYWLVNRMALRVITLQFGAFPPERAGAPWTCRSCSAPLPPARSELLARCAWCGSDNVLGIDLRPRAEGARKERATLEDAFARRTRDRRTYALRGAIALVVLPFSSFGFFHGAHAVTHEAKLVVACEGGDADACLGLGHFYLEVDTYDRAAAMRVFEEACTRNSIDACAELGDLLASGDANEVARGAKLLWTACQANRPRWCSALGQVVKARHPSVDGLPSALALFHRACDAGDARGCTLVAIEMERGAEIAKDEVGAARLFDKSCREQDLYACAKLGLMYFDGRGVPQDVPRAIAMFEKGCPDTKSPVWLACAGLGAAYETGTGVEKNRIKAWDLLRQSCEYGRIGRACTRVGEIQESDGHLDAAYEHYVTACVAGEPGGCLGMASVFVARGKPEQAIGVLRRACKDDHIGMACTMGAIWLKNGKHHLTVDEKEAAELYAAGCTFNDADACDLGGQLAYQQDDHARARPLLTRACDMGKADGCNFLGWELEHGRGATLDDAAALVTYQRSCAMAPASEKHGPEAYGCMHAGLLARKQGDEPRAIALLQKACDWQSGSACVTLANSEHDPTKKAALLAAACQAGEQDACSAPAPQP